MNHPPIPPTCPYFKESGRDGAVFCFDRFEYFIDAVKDNLPTEYLVPLIASVARCAWTDELIRIQSAENMNHDAWQVACDNAEAWKQWGLSQ